MHLQLTNTLTRARQEVVPASPDGILRMYHCGPTVYSTPHLGNLRRFLVADLLVRTARFLGYRVRSVMNITDVGHLLDDVRSDDARDRVLVAAEREGSSPEQIAARYTAEFFAALNALRAEPADYYPRATMHIPQMQTIITRLLERDLAYVTSSGVYLEVTKFPAYGRLSGNTLEALQAGARVDVREEKRHAADFALWVKPAPEHRMQWDSPWGRGFPGWHIECSAMSMQLLGEVIDIHTGGADNIFPHHENEIAQSDGAVGKPVVRAWVHNEHLDIEGAKMSKSEGRVLTLTDLTGRGYDQLAFRMFCLQAHYRSKLNFTWEALDAAATALGTLREFTRRLREVSGQASHLAPSELRGTEQAAGNRQQDLVSRLEVCERRFTEALAVDLGSPQALAALFELVRSVNPELQAGRLAPEAAETVVVTLRKIDAVLALLDVDAPLPSPNVPDDIQELVNQREQARKHQDFVEADRLRSELQARGYQIEDTSQGPRVSPCEGA